jgi:hypothetical protein
VISGGINNGTCVGKKIFVGTGGRAFIKISKIDENPIIAIHKEVSDILCTLTLPITMLFS